MKRQSWDFPYTADKLVVAAQAKLDHHKARLSFWEEHKASTLDKIKAEGLSVDESLAVGTTSNTYQRGTTVKVDDTLLRDLNECVNKVREHQGKCDDYAAWLQVLGSQGQASFNLNHDDWLFFFGGTAAAAA